MSQIRLTEAFKAKHPRGTRLRHPLHGAGKLIEVHESHLIIEWDSPMARIEAGSQVPASDVPYMSRIVEVRTPAQAHASYDAKEVNSDHGEALQIQNAISAIEHRVDDFIDHGYGPSHGGHAVKQNGMLRYRLPVIHIDGRSIHVINADKESVANLPLYYWDQLVDALTQYYQSHGWTISLEQNGILQLEHTLTESAKLPSSVNTKVLNFQKYLRESRRSRKNEE